MKKSKKNVFLHSAVWMLALTILVTCAFAGNTTLAMYRAEAEGTGSTQIAKFDVQFNGVGMVDGMSAYNDTTLKEKLDLFQLITEGSTPDIANGGASDVDANADSDVLQADGKNNRIAPGTNGELPIAVNNLSEVTIQYTLTIKMGTVTDATKLPVLTFSSGGTFLATNGSAAPTVTPAAAGTVPATGTVIGTITGTLKPGESISGGKLIWSWPFNDGSSAKTGAEATGFGANAEIDTPIGISAKTATSYPVVATLVAVQVD